MPELKCCWFNSPTIKVKSRGLIKDDNGWKDGRYQRDRVSEIIYWIIIYLVVFVVHITKRINVKMYKRFKSPGACTVVELLFRI